MSVLTPVLSDLIPDFLVKEREPSFGLEPLARVRKLFLDVLFLTMIIVPLFFVSMSAPVIYPPCVL